VEVAQDASDKEHSDGGAIAQAVSYCPAIRCQTGPRETRDTQNGTETGFGCTWTGIG
jgi:hypothetical protein